MKSLFIGPCDGRRKMLKSDSVRTLDTGLTVATQFQQASILLLPPEILKKKEGKIKDNGLIFLLFWTTA